MNKGSGKLHSQEPRAYIWRCRRTNAGKINEAIFLNVLGFSGHISGLLIPFSYPANWRRDPFEFSFFWSKQRTEKRGRSEQNKAQPERTLTNGRVSIQVQHMAMDFPLK